MSDKKLHMKPRDHEFYPADVENLVDDVIMSVSDHRKISLIKSFLNETTEILSMMDDTNRNLETTMKKVNRIFNDELGDKV